MRSLYPDTGKAGKLLRASSLILLLLLSVAGGRLHAQVAMMLNLSPLDGITLTPDNVFGFAVQSNMPAATEAVVKGSLRYREGGHYFSYTFRTTLRPGMNRFDGASIRPEWTFSGSAFRELFQDYRVLPQGTYEYCVSISPLGSNGEVKAGEEISECLYNKADDLFLINLVDPDNNAKLHEHYPVFSWIANYPFASQLTYRIRVAEIKEGQNAVNAVVRNNPVYTESNLPQTTTTYPVYGTPLKTFQSYGWTVDAYYKGILLGGAEPWKFTIVEDSELVGVPREQAYYEFEKHHGDTRLYAVGELKFKYITELQHDTLHFELFSAEGKQIANWKKTEVLRLGDNRIILPLGDKECKHKMQYTIKITAENGKSYSIPFTYINPLYLQ